MNFFRNPEIKKSCLFYLLLLCTLTAIGFYFNFFLGILLFTVSSAYTLLHFFATFCRYQKLEQLSLKLDSMLHSQTPVHFTEFAEGELSVLQNELSKLTLRLTEQANALLQDKKYLADSMADISHQIRSPLTSIQLILSLLMERDLAPLRRQELMQELSQLLSHINWLVESLLKMSCMDAGTAYLQRIPVAAAELIQKASSPLLIPMELRSQTLLVHLADGNEHFTGDIAWSAEALLNILKNCMEQTPEGGSIEIYASENAICTGLVIQDNGPGISPEDLPHLFERFYKGHSSGKNNAGIGLALARMIISRQNGTLKAENRISGGARFTIKFYK